MRDFQSGRCWLVSNHLGVVCGVEEKDMRTWTDVKTKS